MEAVSCDIYLRAIIALAMVIAVQSQGIVNSHISGTSKSCTTPSGSTGTCKLVTECPLVLANWAWQRPTICGRQNRFPIVIVCCPGEATTEYPDIRTTEYPAITSEYQDITTTEYPDITTTEYPDITTTEYPDITTTEYPETIQPGTVEPGTMQPGTMQPDTCNDISPNCAAIKRHCNTNSYVQERCRKTCGRCQEPFDTCNDISGYSPYCAANERHCNISSYVQERCRKTCGVCQEPETTTSDSDITTGTMQPETIQPETVKPGTVQPGTLQPGTVQPGTVQPGTMQTDTCIDIRPDCAVVNAHHCDTLSYVQVNCRRTCGRCQESLGRTAPTPEAITAPTTEAITAPTNTAGITPTTATTKPDTCIDLSPTCAASEHHCNTSSYVQVRCRRTCGRCQESLDTCIDISPNCAANAHHCDTLSYVQVNCRRTCGRCQESLILTTTTARTTPTTTTTTASTSTTATTTTNIPDLPGPNDIQDGTARKRYGTHEKRAPGIKKFLF